MTDWKKTSHGMKLLAITLRTGFKPGASLRVNPHPHCPLCVIDGGPPILAALHSARYAGDSYQTLLQRFGEKCSAEGIDLNVGVMVRHFTEHFVMQKRV
jgi:hypothetical protein